jgi:hypothetical protein
MTSSATEQDWREPEFAQYLRHHVLDVAVDGTIRAPWQSGFGCVPPGLTTYAPNSLERSWRSLKGLLRKGILGISGDFLGSNGGSRMSIIYLSNQLPSYLSI